MQYGTLDANQRAAFFKLPIQRRGNGDAHHGAGSKYPYAVKDNTGRSSLMEATPQAPFAAKPASGAVPGRSPLITSTVPCRKLTSYCPGDQ
ncbi:hypothetical protein KCP77_09015 [Salmonella enterica subsp. enterica]|nr:hypothetical protein KCP77_09015 [Salmonella enterica subsp. enterica]